MMNKLTFCCALAALALIGCGEQQSSEPLPEPVKAIKYFTVKDTSTGTQRQITGLIEPADETALSFRVSGKASVVRVNTGDLVEKDQVLAEIDAKDIQTELNRAKAELSRSRAEWQNVQKKLQRNRELLKRKLVSQANIDDLVASEQSAHSLVTINEEKVAEGERRLARTKLRAPFAGRITSRNIEPFQLVGTDRTVFELQGDTGFKVNVPVPESLMPVLEYGQPVMVSLPSLNNQSVPGQITSIGSRIETGSAFPVKADLLEALPAIRNGMTANVTFMFEYADQSNPIYLLPISAIDISSSFVDDNIDDSMKGLIYVFNSDTSKLEQRLVEFRDVRGNRVEVVAGLQQGEIVAAAGLPFLRDGQPVTLWQANNH